MATITAAQSGNWSDTSTWSGGVVPGSGDVAALATHVVTADQDITVQALTHTSSAGYLAVTSGTWSITVTAWQVNTVNTSYLIRVSGGTANLNGDFLGGISTGRYAVYVDSGGTATVTNATGGSGSNAHGVFVLSGGTATVTNATGGSGSNALGVNVASGGTATVTNATGGTNTNAYGVYVASGGTATVTNATASTDAPGAVSASSTARILGTMTSGPNGQFPVQGTWLMDDAATVSLTSFNLANWPSGVGDPITLSVQGSSNPDELDVRAGVTYGPEGGLVGSLAVPPPESVAAGVPTDDTVGTAALSLADLAAVTGAQIAAATDG